MAHEGTKVIILDGLHQLVIGSVGTVVAQILDDPPTFEVVGEDANHPGRMIDQELTEDEFNLID